MLAQIHPVLGCRASRDSHGRRGKSDLPENLIFWVNYLGGKMEDFSLNFSRPGGQVAAQYYNFLRHGREGYRKVHMACYHTAKYLAGHIAKMGPFEIIYGGDAAAGIPALCWKIKDGADRGFNLFDLADRLLARGWQVPAYMLPPKCEQLPVQRIIARHGFSRDLADLLLRDMKEAIGHFREAPGA
jgi:glutamate decarboxylase